MEAQTVTSNGAPEVTLNGEPQRRHPKTAARLTRIIDLGAADGLRNRIDNGVLERVPKRVPERDLGARMARPNGSSVPKWCARTGARMKTMMCPNGNDNVPEWYHNENDYVPEWRRLCARMECKENDYVPEWRIMCPNGNHYVPEWKR